MQTMSMMNANVVAWWRLQFFWKTWTLTWT
jgi:hypothetical protein